MVVTKDARDMIYSIFSSQCGAETELFWDNWVNSEIADALALYVTDNKYINGWWQMFAFVLC